VVNNASPAAAPAGAQATKASADKLRKQVRAHMDQKGILIDDLPPAAKALWQTASKAMDDKDFASAAEALTDLDQAVEGIAINGDFIKAKMGRINRDVAKKAPNEQSQKQINGILAEVSDAMTRAATTAPTRRSTRSSPSSVRSRPHDRR